MFRKVRKIAPLVHALRGAAAVAAPAALFATTVLTASTLAGCRDENDPMTHVGDLKDPVKMPGAVNRLIQMYEDAVTKDKKDGEGKHTKPLLDKIVEPLTKICLEPSVKDRTRSKLVKFLSEIRDPRADACLKKTLEDYKPDTNEDDVQNVLRSIALSKSKTLGPQVLQVFKTLEYARPKAKLLKNDITQALLVTADASMADDFLKLLEKPMPNPDNEQAAMQNEAFWQDRAARVLGELRVEKAAKPLLKIILTPTKGPFASTAQIAMVKIGKASIAPTEAVLKGEDQELIKFHITEILAGTPKDANGKIPADAQKIAEKDHVSIAAQVLAGLGSEASIQPLLDALAKVPADDPITKVIIAASLTSLPRTGPSVEAYKKVFEEIKLDLDYQSQGAKEVLAQGATDFFDPSLVSYFVKFGTDLKREDGNANDVDPLREAILVSATKLMKEDQIAEVEAFYKIKKTIEEEVEDEKTKKKSTVKKETEIGKSFESEFKQAKELLTNCKDKVDCYFAALTEEKNLEKDKQFTAMKAAYMIAILGKEGDRAKLVDAAVKIDGPAAPIVRFMILKAIEALSPKGDEASAKALDEAFDKAEEAKDEKRQQDFKIFVNAAARLRARIQ
ncbi:MAG: hypothetical protein U0271_15660 [Polyangiaceae bacterium]